MKTIPLCVDLDGTLTKTDTLWELLLNILKKKPLSLFQLPGWLFQGRAFLKQHMAEQGDLDIEYLPYRKDLITYLQQEKAHGRRLILVTAADKKIATSIAHHLGIFDEVLASDGKLNLAGRHKGEALVQKYGEKGFDYAGNSRADHAVWQHARQAIVVGSATKRLPSLKRDFKIAQVFSNSTSQSSAFLRSLRPHQWVKNILVFVPLLLAHRVEEIDVWKNAILAFIALSLTASSLYILNDLLDLASDRRHERKKHRALPAGDVSLFIALIGIPLLLVSSFLIALLLPFRFLSVLLLYALGSSAYSFYFKRIAVIDVLSIATLFILRIISGGFATHTPLSSWFLAFSGFVFFSGALVKRYAELKDMPEHKAHGRGYSRDDLSLVGALGLASGYMAVAVLAVYIFDSPQVHALYERPYLLWLVCGMLLYWVTHVWLKAYRGQVHDDPIITIARDKISYMVAFVVAVLVILAV